MSGHEQFADDLALYALDALAGEERVSLEQHLAGCTSCHSELQRLRGDMALLALSAGGPRPPQRARQRLLNAIAKEPRLSVRAAKPQAWWAAVPWVIAAAAMVMVVLLIRHDGELEKTVRALEQQVAQQDVEVQQARDVVATFTAPEAQQVTLVAAKTPPQPQGKTFYLQDKGRLIFLANNLPPLPPEKIYELWLIPKTGAPIAAGLFRPDAHGSATVVNPPLPTGVEAKTFAVTLEPESGPHDAPRGSAVMAGTGE